MVVMVNYAITSLKPASKGFLDRTNILIAFPTVSSTLLQNKSTLSTTYKVYHYSETNQATEAHVSFLHSLLSFLANLNSKPPCPPALAQAKVSEWIEWSVVIKND